MFLKVFFLLTIFTPLTIVHFSYANNDLSEIHIKSDNIKIIQKEKEIYFTNNVVVTKDDVVILSNIMKVNYNSDKNDIKNIILTGRVKISNQEFTASGNKGIYDVKNEIFNLSQNVIFNDGASVVSGEKFIYNFKTKKSSLINNKQSKKGKVLIILQDKNE